MRNVPIVSGTWSLVGGTFGEVRQYGLAGGNVRLEASFESKTSSTSGLQCLLWACVQNANSQLPLPVDIPATWGHAVPY